MPYNRFYVANPLQVDTQVSIEGTEHHHMMHVMRLSIGEEVELINGEGGLAKAAITSLNKKQALLHIHASHKEPSSLPQMMLGIPFLRPSKLEWIVEKGTELGVDGFLFYPSDLGEKKLLSTHQLERLHTILLSAIKQSGRLFLPHLEVAANISSLLTKEVSLYYGDTRASAKPLKRASFPLLFITGPEGGFSKEEHAKLETSAQGMQLSEYILRTETAPLAAASIFGWQKMLAL